MSTFGKPVICTSACLGQDIVLDRSTSRIIRELEPYVEFRSICPVLEAGGDLPAQPLKLTRDGDTLRLIDPGTGIDLTERISELSRRYLDSLKPVDGFILQGVNRPARSHKATVYSGSRAIPVTESCSLLFADEVTRRFRGYPIEEYGRFSYRKVRHYFLLRVFLLASFREHKEDHSLQEFHRKNRLLIMKHDHSLFPPLDDTDPDSAEYESLLRRVIAHPPNPKTVAAFFRELIPIVSHPAEFSAAVNDYAANRISEESCIEVLRFELLGKGFEDQSLFAPYPEALKEGAEPDFTRDYWA